ncbi:MAG: hypothetical protein AAFY88_07990, partial [Acidobacteriota bacterium]
AVLIASADPEVRTVDLEGRRPSTVWVHGGAVHRMALDPGGIELATASRDDTVAVGRLDGSTSASVGDAEAVPVRRLPLGGSVYGAAYHPSGSPLAVHSFGGRLGLWSFDDPEPRLLLGPEAVAEAWGRDVHVSGVAFDPGGRLWLRTGEGELGRFELDVEKATLTAVGEPWAAGFAYFSISRDGRRLAGNLGSTEVAVYDLSRDDVWPPPRVWGATFESRRLSRPAWSVDGRRLAVPFDAAVRVFDLDGGDEPITVLGHGDMVSTVALLEDGRLLSGSLDGTVRLWRTDLRDPQAELRRRTEACLAPGDRRRLLLETEAQAQRGHLKCAARRGLSAGPGASGPARVSTKSSF